MEVIFAPRGILQINNARITYKNFSGEPSKFNREGDRNFALIIPDEELADRLINDGWNVKIKPPREEGDTPFMYLNVKVKFNERGPAVYLQSGRNLNRLDEETVGVLDRVRLSGVDLDIRPFDWEVGDKVGRSAYLQSIKAIQDISDRFADEYEASQNY